MNNSFQSLIPLPLEMQTVLKKHLDCNLSRKMSYMQPHKSACDPDVTLKKENGGIFINWNWIRMFCCFYLILD